MRLLLDTDICIYLIKDKPLGVRKHLRQYHPGEVGLSSVTVAELHYGVAKSAAKEKNIAALEEFLFPLAIVSFDEVAALKYGEIRAFLESRGTPIGPMDLLIAAHALSLGVSLVTNNLREFKRIPGLKCVNWA